MVKVRARNMRLISAIVGVNVADAQRVAPRSKRRGA
jgi:hypothetical protein